MAMKRFLCVTKVVAFAGVVLGYGLTASAEPVLQLYLEGATYDATTETWVVYDTTSPARLWVIGNGGQHGAPILGVRLAVASEADLVLAPITLTGSQVDTSVYEYRNYTDPSQPDPVTSSRTVTDGSAPVLYGGGSLPSHGVYGDQTDWQEFELGDFTLTDSPIGDFIGSFPENPGTHLGQINVYDFPTVAGVGFHFDVYNHVEGFTHGIFGPFSHDAGISPAPGAVVLAVIGLGMVGLVRKRLS